MYALIILPLAHVIKNLFGHGFLDSEAERSMTRATRHLERLIRALQSESFESEGVPDAPAALGETSVTLPAPDVEPDGNFYEQPTPRSARASVGCSTSLSVSDETTTPSGSEKTKVYQEEATRLVEQLSSSRVEVATLEFQIKVLKQEREQQENRDTLYIQRLEAEIQRLEEQVQNEMAGLTQRQNQVEKEIPELEEQLRSIKGALHDFNVSEPLYLELKAIPEEQRSAREHILMLAFEKFYKDREEMEALRKSRDTSREALTRANDEVQKLTRELQRLSANHTAERSESEIDLHAASARIERLEAENRDALVQIEVLTAKGSLYDKVKEKLEALECSSINAENQKAVMSATLQVTLQEKERLQELLKEKDHTLDLLSMDKIYLSREVQSQTEQVKKLEAELDRQHEKLRDVKRARAELYNKVLTDNKDSQTATEQRWQAEILRMQERTNQDIEAIRREASAVADEKVRTFREMRDAALADAEGARAELRNNKVAYDELLLRYQELQRVKELKETETHGALKMSTFELDRLKAVLDETKHALEHTRLENEALHAKAKILTEKSQAGDAKRPVEELKNELEMLILGLKEELRVTRAQLEVYENEKSKLTLSSSGDPLEKIERITSTSHKVSQTGGRLKSYGDEQPSDSRSLVLQNLELQTIIRGLEKDNAILRENSREKDVELLKKSGRPRIEQQSDECLVNAIKESEGKLIETVQENRELGFKLRCVMEEKEKATKRLHVLEQDIRKLLQARGSVEQLQSLLKEKGVFLEEKALQSITTSRKIMLKAKKTVSPQIFQKMMEQGEPRCSQHRHCIPHYPKVYSTLLSTIIKRGGPGC